MDGRISARCKMSLEQGGNSEYRVYIIDIGISAAYGGVGKGVLRISYNENGESDGVYAINLDGIKKFV